MLESCDQDDKLANSITYLGILSSRVGWHFFNICPVPASIFNMVNAKDILARITAGAKDHGSWLHISAKLPNFVLTESSNIRTLNRVQTPLDLPARLDLPLELSRESRYRKSSPPAPPHVALEDRLHCGCLYMATPFTVFTQGSTSSRAAEPKLQRNTALIFTNQYCLIIHKHNRTLLRTHNSISTYT